MSQDTILKTLREEQEMYQSVFNSPSGQKVLDRLKLYCSFNQSTFKPNEVNQPYLTIYREGQRSVLLHILNLMDEKRSQFIIDSIQSQKEVSNDNG